MTKYINDDLGMNNLFLLLFILFGASGNSLADNLMSVNYSPAKVTLIGKILEKNFYGEPGFGENPTKDKKEHILLLSLEEKIDIIGKKEDLLNNESLYGVKLIQLNSTGDIIKKLRGMIGSRISLSGTLDVATTGHDHTDAVMTVENIATASLKLKCIDEENIAK
jgi:hypothetical protein